MNEYIIYSVLGLILIGIIYLKFNIGYSKKAWKKEISTKLAQLLQNENSQNPLEWKSLLMEIDKLLDYTFKKSGVKGETMGERLKNAKKYFKYQDYQKIWDAHKARNNLAHEINAKISVPDMKRHYITLKRSIKAII